MLIRAPESWPHAVIAVLAMVVLAALDLGGAFVAKEAVLRRSPALAALGALLFVALFWVFASSLQYADLAPVTFGWVVILQVGVVLLDRYRYGSELTPGKWLAVAVMLLAQAYLLLGPGPAVSAAPASAAPPTAVPARPVAGQGRHVAGGAHRAIVLPDAGSAEQRASVGRHVAWSAAVTGADDLP